MGLTFFFVNFAFMSNKLISWLLFIALCLIWGSSFKLMKDSTASLTGTQIASLRIVAAALVLLPFGLMHLSKIPAAKLPLVIFSAFIGNLLPAFSFAIALTRIDGSLGGIMNSLSPIWVVLIGVLFYGDKIALEKWMGLLIGFLGLVLLTMLPVLLGEKSISFENLGYVLLPVTATILYGVNVNMVSHRLQGINPLHLASVSVSFMLPPALLLLWYFGFFENDLSSAAVQSAIASSSALGIIGSALATILFYSLVKRAGGLFASLVTYGIPFVAIGWGLFDNEKITWIEVSCLVLILAGVYLANRSPQELKA
jgi:drug/metabolite transporter (DMT)-like permease